MIDSRVKASLVVATLGVLLGVISALNGPTAVVAAAILAAVIVLIRLAGHPSSLGLVLFSLLLGKGLTLDVAGRSPDLLYGDLVVVILLISLLAKVWILPSWRGQTMVIPPAIPILLLIAMVSTLLGSTDLLKALALFKTLLLGFAVLSYSSLVIKTPGDLRMLIGVLLLFGVALAVITLASSWINGGSWAAVGRDKNLVLTVLGRNNYVASFFSFLIPLSLFSYLSRGVRRGGAFLTAVAVMSGALLVTQSRGALLACTIASTGVVMWFGKLRCKIIHRMLGIGAMILALALFVPREVVAGLLGRFSGARFMDSGNRLRVIMWVSALKVFWQRPLIGMGLGSTGVYLLDKVGIQYFSSIKTISSPHNFLLEALAETGLIGTAALLGLLWKIYRRVLVLRSQMRGDLETQMQLTGVLGALTAGLLHGLVEPLFRASEFATVYWMIGGGILGLRMSEAQTPVQPLGPHDGPAMERVRPVNSRRATANGPLTVP